MALTRIQKSRAINEICWFVLKRRLEQMKEYRKKLNQMTEYQLKQEYIRILGD
jgi:hypothetical protein